MNSIVAKLMSVEAQPLNALDKKTTSYQSKLTAYGTLGGAISAFQGSLSTLANPASFQSVTATSNNTDILVGSATKQAVAGRYNINVTQIAQSQTLASGGVASTTASIGLGASTTLSFQLGTVSGGVFGLSGGALGAAVAGAGIAAGSLTINGSAIATDTSTRSAKQLADVINAKSATTGVSASAAPTSTSATLFGGAGAPSFGDIDTTGGGSYTLTVGGVQIGTQGAGVAAGAGLSSAAIDAALAGASVSSALTAAGISFTGSAANGDLVFSNSDGANIAVVEAVSGAVSGGIGKSAVTVNNGSSTTAGSTITLASSSSSPITIGGNAPALAGLTAGSGGAYVGASFSQDGNQLSGSLVIDSSNNSLQGIRDAINKAGIGVTATIVSDGSATPNHLVLSSSKTGASATIKLAVTDTGGGVADAALTSLLAYDPAGTQNLVQNSAAQSTNLTVNGIAVTSATNSVVGAIQGVNLTIGVTGSASLTVAKDTSTVTKAVAAFAKAYNDLNKSVADLTGYNASTKTAGPLLGDSAAQSIQSLLRRALGTPIDGLTGSLTTLSSIGIAFQKDGTLTVDSSKLGTAVTNNLDGVSALFSSLGSVSDSLVGFTSASDKTAPGTYDLNVTSFATQGSLTSDAALGATTVIGANTTWAATLNDSTPAAAIHTATISIPAGSYTPSQLATLLQSAINAVPAFSAEGSTVSASIDGNGALVLNTARYGSVANLALTSLTGSAVSDVFGAATSVVGKDVAGSIGGVAVTGSGQFLSGASGSPADGLKVEITGGALGARGTISYTHGYAHALDKLAASFLGDSGFITGRTKGINASIDDIAKQKERFSNKLVDIEKRYRAQYTALDASIASLNSTQSFLTQQFAALSKQTS
ncbi:MAG: flagellar filament capping protein FliD [Pseudomonadota bacterium]